MRPAVSLRNQRTFLNFVAVLRKLVAEHARKIDIVQTNLIGVVLFVVVVLPALVPPTETDDRRPTIRKEIFQGASRPIQHIDMPIA